MKRILIIAIIVAVVIAIALAVILIPKMDKEIETPAGPGYDLFEPETKMLEVEGESISWDEYYGWLTYSKGNYEQTYGEITDWTATDPNGDTYYDAIKDYTLYILKVYKALEVYAEENGIKLTADEKAAIESSWDEMVTYYGGEEALLENITAAFGSREMYDYFTGTSYLYRKCLENVYGEGAKDLPDEDVLDYFADSEYMMVYHVLQKTVDDNNQPLPDDVVAEKKATAERLLETINGFEGTNEEKKEHFIGLVKEFSEDGGGADGYIFLPGYMVEEFEQATKELGDYENSGIVESQFGYHIILRLPLDPDKVPLDYAQMGYGSTLRQIAADSMFYSVTETWAEDLNVTTEEAYDKLNVAEVYAG